MNKLEAKYAAHLEALRIAGEIAWWGFETHKLRLAKNTFYSIDFAVMLADGSIEFHEVKGHWEDDARVKVKVASEKFWMFRFYGITYDRGMGWKAEEFKPQG